MLDNLKNKYYLWSQKHIDNRNKSRLTNSNPVIVSNDCTGGFLYKFLDLKYATPFMWVGISSDEFVTALEDLDALLNYTIKEDHEKTEKNGFPTAVGLNGITMTFPHAKSFSYALEKWEIRKSRLERIPTGDYSYHYPTEHMGFMITEGFTDRNTLLRFARLPVEHKVAFISDPENTDIPFTFLIKGWGKNLGLYSTQNKWTGARFIDQFDYVSFLNNL